MTSVQVSRGGRIAQGALTAAWAQFDHTGCATALARLLGTCPQNSATHIILMGVGQPVEACSCNQTTPQAVQRLHSLFPLNTVGPVSAVRAITHQPASSLKTHSAVTGRHAVCRQDAAPPLPALLANQGAVPRCPTPTSTQRLLQVTAGSHPVWTRALSTGAAHAAAGSRETPQEGPEPGQATTSTSASPHTAHLTDMRHPASWYPAARALRRRIVCHLGPTNSGKTHSALAALKAAGSGVYCGPLRLLACEIADRLGSEGVACDLVTGQEVKKSEGARHSACTVEMAPVAGPAEGGVFEVGVLDEIQMIGDAGRGWGWTRALLGLPAEVVHVCGDPAALPVLRALAEECGDELEVRHYSRLSPLVVGGEALGSLSDLQPGDCLVAFSRRAVHGLQREVARRAGRTACVVYGALPPHTRRQQATLFNAPMNGYDVLVASDAIGMGLNLNIRRVVFTALSKFDGKAMRPLATSEVRQIAGRAGRYGAAGWAAQAAAEEATAVGASDNRGGRGGRGGDGGEGSNGSDGAPRQGSNGGGGGGTASPLHGWHGRQGTQGGGSAGGSRQQGTQGLHASASPSSSAAAAAASAPRSDLTAPVSSGVGYVTCLRDSDLPLLHDALAAPHTDITQACLMPRLDDLVLYYSALCQTGGRDSQTGGGQRTPLFDEALRRYVEEARLSTHYFCGDMAPMLSIATLLSAHVMAPGRSAAQHGATPREVREEGGEREGEDGDGDGHAPRRTPRLLSPEELMTFCTAPADVSVKSVASALLRFVALYCEDGRVGLDAVRAARMGGQVAGAHDGAAGGAGQETDTRAPQTESELRSLEEEHAALDLYCWLAYRMPHAFCNLDDALERRAALGTRITAGLEALARFHIHGSPHHHAHRTPHAHHPHHPHHQGGPAGGMEADRHTGREDRARREEAQYGWHGRVWPGDEAEDSEEEGVQVARKQTAGRRFFQSDTQGAGYAPRQSWRRAESQVRDEGEEEEGIGRRGRGRGDRGRGGGVAAQGKRKHGRGDSGGEEEEWGRRSKRRGPSGHDDARHFRRQKVREELEAEGWEWEVWRGRGGRGR